MQFKSYQTIRKKGVNNLWGTSDEDFMNTQEFEFYVCNECN